MLKLEELLEYAEQLKDDDAAKISLYFITRHLKAGMSRTARVVDKFDFKIIKAPIAPDIAKFFKYTLSNQIISHASKDDIVMKKYTVIDDDIDNKIYAYAMNNAISFSKVINNDINQLYLPLWLRFRMICGPIVLKSKRGLTSLILSEKSAGGKSQQMNHKI